MTNESPQAEALRQSLSLRWRQVRPLDPARAKEVLAAFLAAHVREDLVTRFGEAFNGRRPLTRRFFRDCVEVALGDRIEHALDGLARSPLQAEVLWGSPRDPVAFIIAGEPDPPTVESIFVDGGDAIARVPLVDDRAAYLFLTGARGELFRFPKQLWPSRGRR